MKKTIKLNKDKVNEALSLTDPADIKLLQKRIINAARTAAVARKAATRARADGKDELADKLEARAEELERLVDDAYVDEIDDEESTSTSKRSGDGGEDDGDEEAENPSGKNKGQKGEEDEGEEDGTGSDAGEDDGEEKDSSDSGTASGTGEEDETENGGDPLQANGKAEHDTLHDGGPTGNGAEDSSTSQQGSQASGGGNDPGQRGDGQSDGSNDPKDGTQGQGQGQMGNGGGQGGQGQADDPIKNPFADEDDPQQMPPSGGGGMPPKPRDPTLEEIIEYLKKLKGKAKEGALAALAEIKSDRNITESLSLTEAAKKGLRELDDDEFADLINDTLDMVDESGETITYSGDIEARRRKIKKEFSNPNTRRELGTELSDDAVKDHKVVKAKKSENQKYKGKSIQAFELNLYNTIAHEIDLVKQNSKTYNEINTDYEDDDIILKADVVKNIEEEKIPIIDFYFDVSGSWTGYPQAIKIGESAVATVKGFEDQGLIKLNIFYFGQNDLSADRNEVWGGGTTCWEKIIKNIKKTGATNVVLMTDGDMESQAEYFGQTCVVDGAVWFIWGLDMSASAGTYVSPGYTSIGEQIPKHLVGKGNNTHYSFDVRGNN